MYTHIAYIHTCTHAYTHIHMYIHTITHAYTHIHAYIHTHACTHTHTHTHTNTLGFGWLVITGFLSSPKNL